MHHNIAIKISTANAAFNNCEASEVSRILKGIADKLWLDRCSVADMEGALLHDRHGKIAGVIQVIRSGR